MSEMVRIQDDYKTLLSALLPKLKSARSLEALDEINLFWVRHMDAVLLYLRYIFPGNESYVFTAATYMDYDDNEHLPFLLIGEKHVLDDPLSKYSEICSKTTVEKDAGMLYEQVIRTAEDNIKIIENCKNNILILPLRLLNQSSRSDELLEVGKQAFYSLFEDITSFKDYFEKCVTIQDIVKHARKDIGKLVLFSEHDDRTLPFEERFRNALLETEYMVDDTKPDAYNFFILVFGCIQQAIDVILSCVEYQCVPYIRYPVALHYVSLLSENMKDIANIEDMRYKMSVAFVLYRLCNKDALGQCEVETFLRKNNEFQFNKRLFDVFKEKGINKNSFLKHNITELVMNTFEDFYEILSRTENEVIS